MPHIIIVCTANICRSPVAAAVLRDRLQKRGLANWQVSSAGTWAQLKRGASHNSIRVMTEQGFDISQHEAQMIEAHHLESADLVLCMESGHAEALRVEFPAHAPKIFMLSEMIGRHFNVDDPYGRSVDTYRQMAVEVSELIDNGLDRIVELAQKNATDVL